MENRQPLHQAGKRSLKPIRREPLEIEAECLEKRRESQKEEHYNGPPSPSNPCHIGNLRIQENPLTAGADSLCQFP